MTDEQIADMERFFDKGGSMAELEALKAAAYASKDDAD
jgi:hypothetical protein